MKKWNDLTRETRELWRQQEPTVLALSMLSELQKHFAERTIAAASNTATEAVAEVRFYAGVHDGLRLAIERLTAERTEKK